MKKITFSLITAFFAVCLNGFAQTTVDVGTDWSGSATVPATSGATIASEPAFIYSGTANEVKISSGGTTVSVGSNNVYSGKIRSWDLKSDDAYIEFSLTENSSNNAITTIKVNGVQGSDASATVGLFDFVILYSNKAPFDEANVIGYSVVSLPTSNHATLATPAPEDHVTSAITAPSGCKSYRFYRTANYNGVDYGTSGKTLRIAYLSGILNKDTSTGNLTVNAESRTIASIEYFDMLGKKVSKETQGLVIVKTNYTDGTVGIEKSINK